MPNKLAATIDIEVPRSDVFAASTQPPSRPGSDSHKQRVAA